MTHDMMTIREMCDAFGVTPRTLRFYETKQLLSPRRQGSTRLFTRRDRARLTLILRVKRFGFTLEQIRQLLDLYDKPDGQLAQLTRAQQMAETRLAEMEQQRDALTAAIAELHAQMRQGADMIAAIRAVPAATPSAPGQAAE